MRSIVVAVADVCPLGALECQVASEARQVSWGKLRDLSEGSPKPLLKGRTPPKIPFYVGSYSFVGCLRGKKRLWVAHTLNPKP